MRKVSRQNSLLLLTISIFFLFSQCSNNEEEGADTASFNEEEAMYPAEKVQQNTSLEDNEPLEMGSKPFWSIDKSILLATLNKHKTEIEYKIQQMGNEQEASNGAISPQASLQELKSYKEDLDEEITRVRMASEADFSEVAESAQETLQNIGTKVVSTYIRIERGF